MRGGLGRSLTASSLSECRASGNGRRCREPEGKHAAISERALDRDPAFLELGKQSGDGETESGAAQFTAAGLVDPEKSVEDQLEMLRPDPCSGVVNGHTNH